MQQSGISYERYQRQIILKGFGMEAQQKLQDARVLVVGAGGLGCPVLMTLVGAGIGEIGIADDGLVELSNLHRQFLYNTADIGKLKVEAAERFLISMNPETAITTYPFQLIASNVLDIIDHYEVVIDCTDNFHTRYMLNDACALSARPLVYGAVSRFEGQVAVFNSVVNYRDIFPQPPLEAEVPGCNEAGVVGVLPNIIGNFMANECIKLITGIGETLTGKLMTYSALENLVFTMEIPATAEGSSMIPKSSVEFKQTDYPALCGVIQKDKMELSVGEFRTLIRDQRIKIIDVREENEVPELTDLPHQRIALATVLANSKNFVNEKVIFICQSGKRSLQAAAACRKEAKSDTTGIYSLQGGVNALLL